MTGSKLTVITGAGATVGAVQAAMRAMELTDQDIAHQDTYSTKNITERVRRLPEPEALIAGTPYSEGRYHREALRTREPLSVIPWIMRALAGHYGEPNFETLLGAMEDLEMFAADQRNLSSSDTYRSPLTPFLEASSRHTFLFDRRILEIARHKVLAEIMNFVPSDRNNPKARELVSKAAASLMENFDLNIYTLNYDLLLDSAISDLNITPFDGFSRQGDGTGSVWHAFDRSHFVEKVSSDTMHSGPPAWQHSLWLRADKII